MVWSEPSEGGLQSCRIFLGEDFLENSTHDTMPRLHRVPRYPPLVAFGHSRRRLGYVPSAVHTATVPQAGTVAGRVVGEGTDAPAGFFSLSRSRRCVGVFSIRTYDPEMIAVLTKAIRDNLAAPEYECLRAGWCCKAAMARPGSQRLSKSCRRSRASRDSRRAAASQMRHTNHAPALTCRPGMADRGGPPGSRRAARHRRP